MDIYLEDSASYSDVLNALTQCEIDDVLCCRAEPVFKLIKQAITEKKRTGVTAQLLDADGYVVRQVTSKTRGTVPQDQLNDKQIAVLRALEKVLSYCKREGIQLVGYSDELVAIPSSLEDSEIASAAALAVETHGIYRGAEALENERDV